MGIRNGKQWSDICDPKECDKCGVTIRLHRRRRNEYATAARKPASTGTAGIAKSLCDLSSHKHGHCNSRASRRSIPWPLHHRCATPHKALRICSHPSWFSLGSVQPVIHQLSWTNSIVQTEVMARDNNFPVAKLTPIDWNPTSVPLTRISPQQFPSWQYLTDIYHSWPRMLINALTLAEWMQGTVKGCVLYNKDMLRICHKFCFCKRRIQLPFAI